MTGPADAQQTSTHIDELELDEVIRRANRLLDSGGGTLPRSLKFEWCGIEFYVARQESDGQDAVIISAALGYIPFTGQNMLGRKAALSILADATARPDSPFRLGPGGLVEYRSSAPSDGLETLPDLLQHVTHRVIETSQPLKRLAGVLR